MRNPSDFRRLRERFLFLPFLVWVLTVGMPGGLAGELPFDPAVICRLSVDQIPRSIAIRQGADVWFGYDLEKAVLFKVWQAPGDKPGLIINDFTAQSSGTTLFEEKAEKGWQMKADGEELPLAVRYLGCTQSNGRFELRWALRHPAGTVQLSERIPIAAATVSDRAYRELRAESLPEGASLLLPPDCRKAWGMTNSEGKPVTSLAGPSWHRLFLR